VIAKLYNEFKLEYIAIKVTFCTIAVFVALRDGVMLIQGKSSDSFIFFSILLLVSL